MTIQEAARTALEIQNACNGSGVVFAFAEAMHAICDEANRTNKGTDWKNQHPIVTLFLSKLCSLNGAFFECDYSQASEACEALALVADEVVACAVDGIAWGSDSDATGFNDSEAAI